MNPEPKTGNPEPGTRNPTLRTFIAFELPVEIIHRVEALQQELKRTGLKLRWVRPHNIHLTLKFLGDVTSEQIPAAASALTLAVRGRMPLKLTIHGMGVFPGMRRPRVLWIGLGGEVEALVHLQAVLDDALATAGFEKERRPFNAHLTLARMPDRVDSRRLLEAIETSGTFVSASFICEELVLYQSDLRPQGAVYTPLARAALG